MLVGDEFVESFEAAPVRSARDAGMQTFDQALYALYQAGQVSQQVALAHADSANDLRLMIKQGDAVASGKPLDAQVPSHLALRDGDDY